MIIKPANELVKRYGAKAILYGAPGCHAKGTKILLHSGETKNVEDVAVGDLLMGPDSAPREVLSLARGNERMYRIRPIKGESFVVNEGHILSLESTAHGQHQKGEVKNITVGEYLSKGSDFRHTWKLRKASVIFSDKKLPIDAWFLGVLLGDACLLQTPDVCTADEEIVSRLRSESKKWGLSLKQRDWKNNKASGYRFSGAKGIPNPLTTELRSLNLHGKTCFDKFIPHDYKTSSVADRLRLLAGIIDTDGSYSSGVYSISTVSGKLADDICFVARSLGFLATQKPQVTRCQTGASCKSYRVTISGNCDRIPVALSRKRASARQQKKNPLVSGFSVEQEAIGDYYGFELSGDHLYLTGDFFVHHNSGKTPLVTTAESYRPIICLTEPGTLSLRNSSLPAVECYTSEAIEEFINWSVGSTEARGYGLFWIDSGSQMAEIFLKAAESKTTKGGNKNLGLQAYGEMSRQTMECLEKLHYAPNMNIVVTCKESNQNGMFKPFFPGQDLNTKVPHLFDLVLRAERVNGYLAIRTKSNYEAFARDRSSNLDELEAPNFTNILDKASK